MSILLPLNIFLYYSIFIMTGSNFTIKDRASRAIIMHDDGILLMFRHELKPSWEIKEYYVTIGWWSEGSETPEETLHREIMEEVWIEVDIIDTITVYNYDVKWPNDDVLRYVTDVYLCKNKGDKFFQTHELDGPESLVHSNDNIYEIQKINWTWNKPCSLRYEVNNHRLCN